MPNNNPTGINQYTKGYAINSRTGMFKNARRVDKAMEIGRKKLRGTGLGVWSTGSSFIAGPKKGPMLMGKTYGAPTVKKLLAKIKAGYKK